MDKFARYWQPIICEKCKTHMGWSEYRREEYQCKKCNDLPLGWDQMKKWVDIWEAI